MRISKKRMTMGEANWVEYQKKRNIEKTKKYNQTDKGKTNSFKVAKCRRNNKLKLIEYKGGKCEICGYNKMIPGAYDFHHKNPDEKDFGIASAGHIRSLQKLKKEVDKCILVCRNCHAEIHYEIALGRLNGNQNQRCYTPSYIN
jgi:hypothetical protein